MCSVVQCSVGFELRGVGWVFVRLIDDLKNVYSKRKEEGGGGGGGSARTGQANQLICILQVVASYIQIKKQRENKVRQREIGKKKQAHYYCVADENCYSSMTGRPSFALTTQTHTHREAG